MNTSRANPLTITAGAALLLLCLGAACPLAVTLTHGNLDGRFFHASVVVALASLYVGAVSGLMGLARTARERQWEWFVMILALGPVAVLLYGLRIHRTSVAVASC